MYYRLDVVYPAEYRSLKFDNDTEKIVGIPPGGSGCGFGERVLEFYFEKQADAVAAQKRVLLSRTWYRKDAILQSFPGKL